MARTPQQAGYIGMELGRRKRSGKGSMNVNDILAQQQAQKIAKNPVEQRKAQSTISIGQNPNQFRGFRDPNNLGSASTRKSAEAMAPYLNTQKLQPKAGAMAFTDVRAEGLFTENENTVIGTGSDGKPLTVAGAKASIRAGFDAAGNRKSPSTADAAIGSQFVETRGGKLITKAEGEAKAVDMTDEERAKALIDSEMQAQVRQEIELFGEAKSASSIDELVREQARKQVEEKTALEDSQARAARSEQIAANQAQTAARSQEEAAKMGIYSGATSGTSSGASLAGDTFSNQIKNRLESMTLSYQESAAQREQAMTGLLEAQRLGDANMAAEYRAQLVSAEQEMEKADTNYLNALAAQSEMALAQEASKRDSLAFFSSLVENGETLGTDSLIGMADALGLDFKTVYDFYQSGVANREDKSLSLEEKKLKFQSSAYELDQQMKGINTESSKNIEYLKGLYRDGASQDVISAFKSAAGITDFDDPAYQLENNYKAAQTAYIKSNTAKNYQDLLDAEKEMDDFYGTTDGYLPQSEKYSAKRNDDGSISIDVTNGQSLDNPETLRREDWCAAFANDVLGTNFGDTFADKMTLANADVPAAGMAFIQETAEKWGHVGIVESVDLASGMMSVVEANWQKGSDGKGIISRRDMKISDAAGFVAPANSTPYGGLDQTDLAFDVFSYLDATPSAKGEIADKAKRGGYANELMAAESGIYSSLLTDPEDAKLAEVMTALYTGDNVTAGKKKAFQVYQAIVNDNPEQAWALVRGGFNESLSADEEKDFNGRNEALAALEDVYSILTDESTSEYIADETGWLSGNLADLQESLGQKTNLSEVESKIKTALQAYTNAVSGAAFTPDEFERYKNVFPEISNVAELNATRIKSLYDTMKGRHDELVNTKTGGRFKTYDSLWGDRNVEGETQGGWRASQSNAPEDPESKLDYYSN